MMRAALSAESRESGLSSEKLEDSVARGIRGLLGRQHEDGHWAFILEADATIPAEYILLKHFLDEVDLEKEAKLAAYIREIQAADHGGWPLWHDGPFDLSASVKGYWALKAAGDPVDAPHMIRARSAILEHGGAARTNVFTRTLLALFEQVPWRATPVMPVEIMLLPYWAPFHLEKISYWSRTVVVPLLVLMAVKPKPKLRVDIPELFVEPAEKVKNWHPSNDHSPWAVFFRNVERVLRVVEPLIPARSQRKAIDRAVAWVTERLNGEDGLGAIYPAMANSVMMFECLGYRKDYPALVTAKKSVEKLLAGDKDRFYCQPCVSPVWDTGLACHALIETGEPEAVERAKRGLEWLKERQILDVEGDWIARRPNLRPGGWAFQYANPHYPDLDDTAVVTMALHRSRDSHFTPSIARATEWVEGMQSSNGGWAAFEVDNEHYYLNHIPFADHGALLDPPTVDVTARCVSMLAQLGRTKDDPVVARALDYLRREQEPDGSWYGRWGTNYVYGTWSALCALNAIGIEHSAPEVRRAVAWLVSQQHADGGWGEGGESYYPGRPKSPKVVSTASQTAWAVLGLMAAGEVENPSTARGVDFLTRTQNEEGLWDEPSHTAVGFARVFYLRYHGYRAFFPVWAVARYRNLTRSNTKKTAWGM